MHLLSQESVRRRGYENFTLEEVSLTDANERMNKWNWTGICILFPMQLLACSYFMKYIEFIHYSMSTNLSTVVK